MEARGVGLAASFTCSKVLTEAFEFWLHRLAIEGPLRIAGYNQIFNVSAFAAQAVDALLLRSGACVRVSVRPGRLRS